MEGRAESAGVCFSSQRPTSRSHAERLFAVMEWGNACHYVTDFIVPFGIVLWYGQVDPGRPDTPLGGQFGVQVFIENPAAQQVHELRTVRLLDDLDGAVVHAPGRDRGNT